MSTNKTNLTQCLAEIDKLKEEANRLTKEVFAGAVAEIFDKYPDVQDFSWRQYTNYFNDGDVCNFHAYTDSDSIYVNGLKYYDHEENPREKGYHIEVSNEISSCLREIGQERLLDIFGDHAEVVCERGGKIIASKYTQHD